MISSEV